ncbi:hypothetical protein MSP8887_00496 [Marinomonas spartinae]|uniref:Uncharacterized protein n=1 Tax=Marinomonas spartinae TaxID=1792290 RepID=A0A1A8THF4_9GAMM|nr:hypothetical protein [Marinomonas spartinae]SBS26777.1 hypothetical protein MSP8887_00496 [Marinomonas spartinae]SBS32988.1 hypothetical protein MSP8886_02623 [Marinomonas spartinae]
MADNLIYLPVQKRSPKCSFYDAISDRDLTELRDAFDRAREQWPLEIAELPENNKKYAHYKK